jgi:hypothetical protein
MAEHTPVMSSRQELERRAQTLAERRDAFLSGIKGRWLETDAEHRTWAELVAERRELDAALERVAVEERIASHQRNAEDARAAGLLRKAHHYEVEADYLRERLAEVHHG